MNLTIISGSRADAGLLEWPTKLLREDPFFSVAEVKIWGQTPAGALQAVSDYLANAKPDYILILGDRFEIMAAAMAAHLQRIPIAHIGGGDVTEGSYDDAMRDCISRMATLHFATNQNAEVRLRDLGRLHVYLVGNPGIDYIRNAPWKGVRPIAEPYVVVSYQAETIDGTIAWKEVVQAIGLTRHAAFLRPNNDAGSDKINAFIDEYKNLVPNGAYVYDSLSHAEFLNLISHCDEFIGNSSAMLYEAPAINVKCHMIGKRQRGRVVPFGDGRASERIVEILKRA